MKFSCLKENLVSGVNAVGHIALRASSLPVLNNIFISAGDTGLYLSATNLEMGIEHTVRGKLEEPGDCLVSAKLLLDLLPLLPDGQMHLETTPSGLSVKTQDTESTLRISPVTDFPIIPAVEGKKGEFLLPQPTVKEVFEKTLFAVGRVEQRPQFNGIFFAFKKNTFTAAATDGYRLSEVVVEITDGAYEGKIIIPNTTAQEITRLLTASEASEAIHFLIGENQLHITVGSTQLTSRLVEGEFPDYQALFPEKSEPVIIASGALTKAVKATTLFSRSGVADITVTPKENNLLEIFSESGEIGSHRTTIPFVGKIGTVTPVVLNARFLIEGVAACNGDTEISFGGADHPVLVTPQKQTAAQYRYLLMPIRE